jgi:hypothetical protein
MPGATGTVLLVEDLTEMQLLEAELTHSERLPRSAGSRPAAHEIGNPLTASPRWSRISSTNPIRR